MLIVTANFVGHGYNMLDIGTRINPPPELAAHLVAIGVAAEYEAKVDPLPQEVKKNEPSVSLPAAQVVRKRTRKSSAKKLKP
jgi:hypothetical protein